MPLTDFEKSKVRHHLGYLQVKAAQTFVLGVPAAVETQFIIEGAMNLLLPEAEGECRRHLSILDGIEGQMNEDRELLAVQAVDELKINPDEMKRLRKEYQYWRHSLANLFGVFPNPWDRRWLVAEGGINVPVVHS